MSLLEGEFKHVQIHVLEDDMLVNWDCPISLDEFKIRAFGALKQACLCRVG